MKAIVAVGLLVVFSIVEAQMPQPLCQEYFTYNNGSCYRKTGGEIIEQGVRIRQEGMTFAMANRYCSTLNPAAHLVAIEQPAELEFIYNMYAGIEPIEMWVGLCYNATTLRWEWVTGEPALNIPWEPFYGEPLIIQEGGALMFLSEVITAQTTAKYGYGIEVSDYFTTEYVTEEFAFICEYELGMIQTNWTWNETMTTANPNGTNSTAAPATTAGVPATTPRASFPPQVLFQQDSRPQLLSDNRPLRLSDKVGFGYLHEITAEDRKRARKAHEGPAAYRQRGGRPAWRYYATP